MSIPDPTDRRRAPPRSRPPRRGWLLAAAVLFAVCASPSGPAEGIAEPSGSAARSDAPALGRGVLLGDGILVRGARPGQVELTRWAVSRFEAAGLELPAIEIRFHAGRDGCRDHLGLYAGGTIDFCESTVDLIARDDLLHELAHAWADANVAGPLRERFLRLRDLSTWAGTAEPWRRRGFEHAAEIVSWHLGDRVLLPSIPGNSRREMAEAFTFLTGRPVVVLDRGGGADALPGEPRAAQGRPRRGRRGMSGGAVGSRPSHGTPWSPATRSATRRGRSRAASRGSPRRGTPTACRSTIRTWAAARRPSAAAARSRRRARSCASARSGP